MKKVLPRRPSASLVVSMIALVVAASGTAVAASKLVKGDLLIAKHSLSGNRLRNHTLTGKQINLNKLGTVPSAKNADTAGVAVTAGSATNATNATNATTAANANALGGQPASAFLSSANRLGTDGVRDVTGNLSGNTVTLFTVGPFTITLTCTRSSTGNTTVTLNASSSLAGSWIDGNLVGPANQTTNLGIGVSNTGAAVNDQNVVDLEASDGTGVELLAADGVNSLGTDCWANWSGIH